MEHLLLVEVGRIAEKLRTPTFLGSVVTPRPILVSVLTKLALFMMATMILAAIVMAVEVVVVVMVVAVAAAVAVAVWRWW